MERKRKGPWAMPISARRLLSAAVPIGDLVGPFYGMCDPWMGEHADCCCCSSGCYWCESYWCDGHEPPFMCLSKRSKALHRLGVPPEMLEHSCRCPDCRFPGFGTIGSLMQRAA